MAEHHHHKPTRTASFLGSSNQRKGVAPPDFDFNLVNSKAKVLKVMDEKVPSNFRKFFASTQYDRLLQTLLLYFTAVFQLDWVVKTMEKSRKQHLEGYNPYAVAARMRELEDEVRALRLEISPIYSALILRYSNYTKPQQDMLFFETLYETLICILDDAFLKLARRPDIEQEIGNIFRSRHFNLYKRKNMPTRSVDTLGVKELYALKNETSNRALNSKMLASLFEKPPTIGVTVASVTNSPLITQFITSPIVARSLMKDPEARQSMLKVLETGTQSSGEQARKSAGAVFRSAAMLHGISMKNLQESVGEMQMPADAQTAMGVVPIERGYRADRNKAPTGMIAPEAAGLPVDEAYNHLALLKRYVIYGPSMGMNPKDAQQAALSSMPPQSPTARASGGGLSFAHTSSRLTSASTPKSDA